MAPDDDAQAIYSKPDKSSPERYVMGAINNPEAIRDVLWQTCWALMFREIYGPGFLRGDGLRDGPAAAAGFDRFTDKEIDCVRAAWMKECVEEGDGGDDAEDWLEELLEHRCDSDRGGTPRAVALGRLITNKARDAGREAGKATK